jgi:hypothetical protein
MKVENGWAVHLLIRSSRLRARSQERSLCFRVGHPPGFILLIELNQ